MKKLLALLLALTLIATLSACGGSDEPEPEYDDTEEYSDTEETGDEEEYDDTEEYEDTEEYDDTQEGSENSEETDDAGEEATGYEDDPIYQAALYFLSNADGAYMGLTETNEDVVLIETGDTAALLVVDGNTMQSVSFIGPYEADGALFRITDEQSGIAIQYEVVEVRDDNTMLLSAGDLGTFELAPADLKEAVTAMLVMSGITEPVL